MKQHAPQFETDRIIIRRYKPSDAEDLYNVLKDKAMSRWTFALPHPYPQEAAVKYIRQTQSRWRLEKGYAFAVVHKETGKVIGNVGLNRVEQTHKCGEIGFCLGKKYWGQGLMTEAIERLLHFGFNKLKLHRIYGHTFQANTASKRVFEKTGFTLEGTMRQAVVRYKKRHDLLNYGILRGEYKS
ncbi:MAG: GNAT family N-acetyltransferase [Phycisphaerae bacterium]|nr:GNAT family N-acetyltransferase [Phycisphaerae bacterium]